MDSKKTENLYSDEISLLSNKELEDYIRLNLRKISVHRRKFEIPVIGIAGAEGKTTTKRMLSAILRGDDNILETPPNCSTTSGVTSTLLKLNESHKYAILELGIVNPKQFELAVEVAEPNIAVITNIGEAHLATLGDKYLIADAKIELIRNLPEDGFAVLNIDDDLVSALGAHSPTPYIIKFGLNQNAHFFASKIEYLGPDGIVFYVNDFYRFHLPIYSTTSIYNALTAISVARVLGVEFEDIQKGLQERFSLIGNRGNLIRKKRLNILDYSYDATVNAVTKACESLSQFKKFSEKLVLVIGDMSNPGPDVENAHLKMGYYIAALPIDIVITVGKDARNIASGIERLNIKNKKTVLSCPDKPALNTLLKEAVGEGDTVLVIGSKALELEESVQFLADQYSD